MLPCDVTYLDDLLLDAASGRIKILPASVYAGIDPTHLVVWGTAHARYTFPTKELIDWLRTVIAGRKAIEVGAGNGDLGYHLGIPRSDNYSQQIPHIRAYYELLRQVPTRPSADVERMDAVAAIHKYNPRVVVGRWITQKYKEGDKNANIYGPEEEEILGLTECYIHIGNEVSHGDKRIRSHPHRALRFDWLVTKSVLPEANVIYVWGE